jgi:hypothetical protein
MCMNIDSFLIKKIKYFYNQDNIEDKDFLDFIEEYFSSELEEAVDYFNKVRVYDYTIEKVYRDLTKLVFYFFYNKKGKSLCFNRWGSWGIQTNILNKSDIDILVKSTMFDFEEIRNCYKEFCEELSLYYNFKYYFNCSICNIKYNRMAVFIKYKDFTVDLKHLDNEFAVNEQLIAYNQLSMIDNKHKALITWLKFHTKDEQIYKMIKNILYRMFFKWPKDNII